jgi:YD repeat-containing protein
LPQYRSVVPNVIKSTATILPGTGPANAGKRTGTSYTYHNANRLLSVDNRKEGASFAKFGYSHISVNNRTSRTETATALQHETDGYSYDAVDQVTGVSYGSGRNVSYNYDAAGNRTTVNDNRAVIPYTANQLNQYTGIGELPAPGYNGSESQTMYNGWIYSYHPQERLIALGAYCSTQVPRVADDFTTGRGASVAPIPAAVSTKRATRARHAELAWTRVQTKRYLAKLIFGIVYLVAMIGAAGWPHIAMRWFPKSAFVYHVRRIAVELGFEMFVILWACQVVLVSFLIRTLGKKWGFITDNESAHKHSDP